MDTSYLIFVFGALLNIQTVNSNEAGVNSSYWVSLVLISLCIGYLIFNVIFLSKYYDRLEEPKIKEKFGVLYENFNFKKDYKIRIMY